MAQATIVTNSMRPTRLTKPKTVPDRTLFCRKVVGMAVELGGVDELILVDNCPPEDDVKVRVRPASVVTAARGGAVVWNIEDVVEAEVDEGVAVEEVEEEGVEEMEGAEVEVEVAEAEVAELEVEWAEDVEVVVGRGKR
jgi:hypothetical protein